jgi:hypothetical protein
LVPFERDTAVVKNEPKRFVIYVAYGGAIIVSILVVITAIVLTKRSKKPQVTQGDA